MNFKLYREYGALNSKPVFDAIESGIRKLGWRICDSNEDIPIIWSVLWSGRMRNNQLIYTQALQKNKPVLIIEVGNLKRNYTWRLSLNHINNLGFFANKENLDISRPKKLGVSLCDFQKKRSDKIMIATQHKQSLQWQGQKSMEDWVEDQIRLLRSYTDRSIVIRPHPRSPLTRNISGAEINQPKKLADSYDDFDIDYNYHCVINFNSGPAVQAAIQGVPIICDHSSLAYPVSDQIENIENIILPDREQWFLELCHTEWHIDEIAQGLPLIRLQEKFDL